MYRKPSHNLECVISLICIVAAIWLHVFAVDQDYSAWSSTMSYSVLAPSSLFSLIEEHASTIKKHMKQLADGCAPSPMGKYKPGIVIGSADIVAIERGPWVISNKLLPRIIQPGSALFRRIQRALTFIKHYPCLLKLTRMQYYGLLNKVVRLISGIDRPFKQHNENIDKIVAEKIYPAVRKRIMAIGNDFEHGLDQSARAAIREMAEVAALGNKLQVISIEAITQGIDFTQIDRNSRLWKEWSSCFCYVSKGGGHHGTGVPVPYRNDV